MIKTIRFFPLKPAARPLLCRIGLHRWKYWEGVDRECSRCGRKEFWYDHRPAWIQYEDIPR